MELYLGNNLLSSFSVFDFSKPVPINLLVSLTPTPSAFFHLYVPPQDILMLIVVLLALQQLERINQKFPKMYLQTRQQEHRYQNT